MGVDYLRRQSRRLLIDPSTIYGATDHGHTWLTDRFVLARADVFKNPPKAESWLPPRTLRRVFAQARSEELGMLATTGIRVTDAYDRNCGELLVVTGGRLHVTVNRSAWEAWVATGLTPRLTVFGVVSWWGKVRGNRTLFGALMPTWLGGDAKQAES